MGVDDGLAGRVRREVVYEWSALQVDSRLVARELTWAVDIGLADRDARQDVYEWSLLQVDSRLLSRLLT